MNVRLQLIPLFCLIALPTLAGEPHWFLMSREDGCLSTEPLVKREQLPHAPATPDEFAEMMRTKGYRVTVTLPEGFPAELEGKVLQVTVRDNLAPIFVTEDICRQVEKGP